VGVDRAVATQGERRFRNPGRKRLDDRKALCGILFVLYTAIPWEFLPQEMGTARHDVLAGTGANSSMVSTPSADANFVR
jgi:transposase